MLEEKSLFEFEFELFQNGETMLIGAVRGGHVEIVRALLNKYADVDVRGQVGVTFPLFIFKTSGNPSHVLNVNIKAVTQHFFYPFPCHGGRGVNLCV